MIKKTSIILFFILLCFYGQGQDQISRKGYFYVVPETSFWFGLNTRIEAAPQLGYHISDRLSIGAGPHYAYYKYNDYYNIDTYNTNIWGIKTFTRISLIRNAEDFFPFYIFSELFAHIEYERISLERRYFDPPTFPEEGRLWADYLFIGAGITQRIGNLSSYSFMLLWNLNDSYFSIYSNPVYRVGLNIYF